MFCHVGNDLVHVKSDIVEQVFLLLGKLVFQERGNTLFGVEIAVVVGNVIGNGKTRLPFGFAALLVSSVWLMLHTDRAFEWLGLENSAGSGPLASALGRFVNASALYEQNGLRLFGSFIEFRSLRTALLTNQEAVILDSAYLYLVISQGVAATLIMLWLFGRSMRAQFRKKQYVLLITMGVFLLSGLMERFALDSTMNFALLSAFSALDRDAPPAEKNR